VAREEPGLVTQDGEEEQENQGVGAVQGDPPPLDLQVVGQGDRIGFQDLPGLGPELGIDLGLEEGLPDGWCLALEQLHALLLGRLVHLVQHSDAV